MSPVLPRARAGPHLPGEVYNGMRLAANHSRAYASRSASCPLHLVAETGHMAHSVRAPRSKTEGPQFETGLARKRELEPQRSEDVPHLPGEVYNGMRLAANHSRAYASRSASCRHCMHR